MFQERTARLPMDLRHHLSPIGLLPPVDGGWPTTARHWSPYATTLQDFVRLTDYSVERCEILRGFFALRRELKRRGLKGIQWVDGSFLEHEDRRGRPPGDLDVVTWMERPDSAMDDWPEQVLSGLPPGNAAKSEFHCDIYFDLCTPGGFVPPNRAAYWLGLFGHTRAGEWKGFFQVSLGDDEDAVLLGEANAIQG